MEQKVPDSNRIIKNTSVDFKNRGLIKPVHLVQYDNGLPVLAIALYSDGAPYKLPIDAEANIRFKKPDGKVVLNPVYGCSEDRQTLYVEITYQMTTAYGFANPVIEIVIGDKVAASSKIPIEIEKNPIQENDEKSTDEMKTLIKYVEDAKKYSEESKASADSVAGDASKAAESATRASNYAAEAGTKASQASASAAASKDSENAAKEYSTSAGATKTAIDALKVKIDESVTKAANSASAAKTSENNAAVSAKNAANVVKDTLKQVIINQKMNLAVEDSEFEVLQDSNGKKISVELNVALLNNDKINELGLTELKEA